MLTLNEQTKKPHKHAEIIKAWADGAQIQCRIPKAGKLDHNWVDIPSSEPPIWLLHLEYRVKPHEPKPDRVFFGCLNSDHKQAWFDSDHASLDHTQGFDNVKFTVDDETGELKSVEILK